LSFAVNKGRFRRLSTINVTACQDNTINPPNTVLPRKAAPGTDDVPKIAVSMGGKDQLDVVLTAVGLDPNVGFDCYENRTYVPKTNKLTTACAMRLASQSSPPQLTDLLTNMSQLNQYNMLFISCSRGKWAKLDAATQGTIVSNLQAWVAAGGRLVATDNSYDYVAQAFPSNVGFANGSTTIGAANVGVGNSTTPVSYTGRVNDPTLLAWLVANQVLQSGTTTLSLDGYLDQWSVVQSVPTATRDIVDATDAKIYTAPMMPGMAATYPQSIGFDITPQGAAQACGRVLFTSYHTLEPTSQVDVGSLSPQERILEYLILEAGACQGPIG
jgi:hypothetical protein